MFSFGFYVIWQNVGSPSSNFPVPPAPIATNSTPSTKKIPKQTTTTPITTIVNNPSPIPNPAPVPTPLPTPTPPPQPIPVIPPPKKNNIYNEGTYIGTVADAYYGNVQVRVTISNDKITNVQFLDYPQDRNTSVRINSRAMPILIQEAISVQSANVNGVSGASATSSAFVESLTSALNQAKV